MRVTICRVFINFNARLSIIAVGISSAPRDRHFTAEDREDDKIDDELNELSIEITLPWQMTQRKAAIVSKKKKKEGKKKENGRPQKSARISCERLVFPPLYYITSQNKSRSCRG